ncbi:MAG: hypothetical protein HY784_07205 [Chloroflexi bacterium]|nr:hypothetical protein [Chloroflexota bacterium]
MGSHLTILLCYPRSGAGREQGSVARLLVRQLDLIHLAARTPREHRLLIQDENLKSLDLNPRPDLALLLASERNARRACALAADLRAAGVAVILAGPGVSSCPQPIPADVVLEGPADLLWPQALADFQAGRPGSRYTGARQTDWLGLPLSGALAATA